MVPGRLNEVCKRINAAISRLDRGPSDQDACRIREVISIVPDPVRAAQLQARLEYVEAKHFLPCE